MELVTTLRKRLVDAGVAGGNVYWVERPQAGPLPALVLQIVSEDRPQHLKGFEDMRTARVQFAALSKIYLEAKGILEAAIAVATPNASVTLDDKTVEYWRASLDGLRDTSEDVPGIGLVHRPLADLSIRYFIR